MLNPINVLTVGIDRDELMPDERIIWGHHESGKPSELSAREYVLQCKKYVEQADVIVVNCDKGKLSVDEVFIITSAYTISTPIFSVGHNILCHDEILDAFLSNKFDSFKAAIEHIINHYI